MQKTTNNLIFVFIVNISMRKIILEVEYFKSMIYQLFKIFKRKTYLIPRWSTLRHLFALKIQKIQVY